MTQHAPVFIVLLPLTGSLLCMLFSHQPQSGLLHRDGFHCGRLCECLPGAPACA